MVLFASQMAHIIFLVFGCTETISILLSAPQRVLRVLVILFPFAEWDLCLFVPCMSSFPVDITGLPVNLFYIVFTLSSMNRLKSWEMTKSMNIANWEKMRNSTTVTFTELGALIELLFHVCSHWDVRSKRLIVNGMLWILVALVYLKT